MRIGIVGAGMAGLACARVLADRGGDIWLFDKGRGPGGRMSTRRVATPLGEAAFDHGAQYFTARHPRFVEVVNGWQHRGLVAPWPEAHAEAWVGVPGMNAVIGDMARRHKVAFGEIVKSLEQRGDGWHFRLDAGVAGPFDLAILAVPAEQAATLISLHDFEMARVAIRARSKPCWTGLFAFGERLATAQDVFRDRGIIAWAARNSAKPGRRGPESWVVQAQPSWTEAHCEDDRDDVSQALLDALASELGVARPDPVAAAAHRWRFAMSNGTGDQALWNPGKQLGVCGDWLMGPRVESAWLSGHLLGQRIVGNADDGEAYLRTA
ncbi:MAG: NAD(P)-binding protein [Novosphingobium sp.]|nr:NAD(P)-binding protein [Novosphingobium sp.]